MRIHHDLVRVALLCLTASSMACIPPSSQQQTKPGELERLGAGKPDAVLCEAPRAGTLGAHEGGVWFQDEAMRSRAEQERQGRATWEPEEVLIGYLGGGFGQLIPHTDTNKLIATRGATWSVEEERQLSPAQLVTLDASTMTVAPWWDAPADASDIRLLGRVGAALVVLTVGEQGRRVWILAAGQRVPLASAELMDDAGAVSGPPAAGLTRWPIMGKNGVIHLADVDASGVISGGAVKTEATSFVRADATHLVLYFADNTCARAPLDAPETWSAQPRADAMCDATDRSWERPILDGQPVAERLPVTASGCKVQHRVALPLLPDLPPGESALQEGRVALVQLVPKEAGQSVLQERLLVRATTLAVSFAFADESSADTVSAPTFALAIPPEALRIEQVRMDGQAFWEVKLDLDLPYDPWPACVTGQLIYEAAEAPQAPWRRAVVRQYVEFGKCE
jgi:hypothetical protein